MASIAPVESLAAGSVLGTASPRDTRATPSTAACRASGLSETVVATMAVVPCVAWKRAIRQTDAATSSLVGQLT